MALKLQFISLIVVGLQIEAQTQSKLLQPYSPPHVMAQIRSSLVQPCSISLCLMPHSPAQDSRLLSPPLHLALGHLEPPEPPLI